MCSARKIAKAAFSFVRLWLKKGTTAEIFIEKITTPLASYGGQLD